MTGLDQSDVLRRLEQAGAYARHIALENRWLVMTITLTETGMHIEGRRIVTPGIRGVQLRAVADVTWRHIEQEVENPLITSIDELVEALRNPTVAEDPDS